jgi:hypothetical protein
MSEKFQAPWNQHHWRADVDSWIAGRLSNLKMKAAGASEQVHARPWSTVLRVPTENGSLYFKAGGPTQRFEPALLRLLNERQPGAVLPLLAADTVRGWSLMPDGGQTLRKANDGKFNLEDWLAILPRYAKLQTASADWIADLQAAGVPDRRLPFLARAYSQILNDTEATLIGEEDDMLTEAQHERLLSASSNVAGMIDELSSFGIPAALEHGDLHDGNVFADGQIYDWGDAALSHPFFTLLLPLRFAARHLGVSEHEAHPNLIRLRDTYLGQWSDLMSPERLLQAWKLAHHLAKFQRTMGWYQVVKTTAGLEMGDLLSVSGWFLEFLQHPTDRF